MIRGQTGRESSGLRWGAGRAWCFFRREVRAGPEQHTSCADGDGQCCCARGGWSGRGKVLKGRARCACQDRCQWPETVLLRCGSTRALCLFQKHFVEPQHQAISQDVLSRQDDLAEGAPYQCYIHPSIYTEMPRRWELRSFRKMPSAPYRSVSLRANRLPHPCIGRGLASQSCTPYCASQEHLGRTQGLPELARALLPPMCRRRSFGALACGHDGSAVRSVGKYVMLWIGYDGVRVCVCWCARRALLSRVSLATT